MKSLGFYDSPITDISVVSSMPLLEEFSCWKVAGKSSAIKDLTPLTFCSRLTRLAIWGNTELKDLSPLSACTALKILSISLCPHINSLAPLSALPNLQELNCQGIDPQTSLLPLASCSGIKALRCDENAVDLEELRRRRPGLFVTFM